MLIDKTYFTGKLNIPNVEQGTINPDLVLNNDNLTRIINEYTFKFLTDVFGVSISKEILAVIETDGTITPGTDQKYIDLIDGVDDWLGLRYEIQGVKYSQIANFCYCKYLYENETQLSNIGNSVNTVEKGTTISSWNKYNDAWREMIKQRQLVDLGFPLYLDYLNPYTTLYEYISNSEDWDLNYFRYYENTNSLGI